MTTARQIVKDAFYKINVLGTGMSLSDDDAQRAFRVLNQMLSTWSVEGNLTYIETKETFPLTGTNSYTIGSGADFDTVRPDRIITAFTTQGTTDYPMESYELRQYSRISDKGTGGTPGVYYYDANYPLATLFLYPAPTSQSTITIYSEKPLTQFTTLDTDFSFPPEYETALVYNLAVWIAGDYERVPSRLVEKIANSSKMAVERQNLKNNQNISTISVPQAENQNSSCDVLRGY